MKSFYIKIKHLLFFVAFTLFTNFLLGVSSDLVTLEDFEEQVDVFLRNKEELLAGNRDWQVKLASLQRPDLSWFERDFQKAIDTPQQFWAKKFNPYVQKVILPSGSKINVLGDLHAEYSALAFIKNKLIAEGVLNEDLKILVDDHFFLFLGDYIDRGSDDLAVLNFIIKLCNQNPDKVFVLRGNHEVFPCVPSISKLFLQICEKSDTKEHAFRLLVKVGCLFELLPVAAYIGFESFIGIINYIQFCHGFLDHGYNPKRFLADDRSKFQSITSLRRDEIDHGLFLNNISKNEAIYEGNVDLESYDLVFNSLNLGFLWSDFEYSLFEGIAFDSFRCAFRYGKDVTGYILKSYDTENKTKILGVIRGHQHGEDEFSDILCDNFGFNISRCQYDRFVCTLISNLKLFPTFSGCGFARLYMNEDFLIDHYNNEASGNNIFEEACFCYI